MKKGKLHLNKLIGLFMTFTMLLFLSGNTFAQKKQISNVIDKTIVQKKGTIEKSTAPTLITKADRQSRNITKPDKTKSNKAAMLYEGFEGGVFPPAGWTIQNIVGDPSNLILDDGDPIVGAGSAYFNGYGSGTTSPQESRLISPMVNVAIPAILTYIEWVNYVGACETYVEISEDGTNWTTIYTPTEDVFMETNIIIPDSYIGKDVYFAFHYIDTDLWEYGQPVTYWEIDEISLHGFTGTEITDLSFGDDQKGASVVDADNFVVTSPLYQSTDLTSLAPDFMLSVGAKLSPEAEWYDAEGAIIPHDFTDTVEVDVISGDGEHTQLWKIKANKIDTLYVGNELSNFNFGADQSGEVWYDNYARRVEAKVLFDSTLNIAPTFEFSEKATVTPALGDTVDFTEPVNYTVVSESGETVTYRVTVTNAAAEQDADIYTFSVENQVGDAVIGDNTVLAYVNNDKPLNDLKVTITTSPFATMVSPTTADFEAGPVTYKVVAEDDTVSIDWSVRLVQEDTLFPVVTAMYDNLDTLTNVGDSAQIKINESPSNVALVMEGKAFADLDDLDNLVDDYQAAYVGIATGDSIGTLFTEGLKVGNYLAYAIDSIGNISVAEDTLVVVIGTKEVATIGDLWEAENYNMQYKLTGEAVISKIVGFKGRIHIQDATAGILFEDYDEDIVTTEYNRYDGITGLTGTLYNSHGTLKFEAVSDPGVASSTGNTIEPKLITLQEFEDNQEDYQSQLIKINNVNITSEGTFANGENYEIQDYTNDGILRSHFYDVDYIGTAIPDTIVNLVGVAVYDFDEAKIAPRDLADFTGIEGSEFFTMDYDFEEVLVGDTVSETLYYGNIGNGIIAIDSIRFEADMSVFSFKQVTPSTTQESYEPDSVMVTFNPDSSKNETALVIYYYDEDQIDTTVIKGTGFNEPTFTIPYSLDFNVVDDNIDVEGWTVSGTLTKPWSFSGTSHLDGSDDEDDADIIQASLYHSYGSAGNPDNDWMISPAIDFSDAEFPMLKYWESTQYASYGYKHQVGISTDRENWTVIYDDFYSLEDWQEVKLLLTDYVGQIVYIGFNYQAEDGDNWFIDDLSIVEQPTVPVFTFATPVEFGAANTDVAVKQTYEITNAGVSYLVVDEVSVIGTDASMFTIPELTLGEETYDESVMSFDITFTPTTIGEKTAQLVIKHSDGRNANVMDTVELVGYGVNCEEAMEAVIGTNNAPYAPSWYKFTPENNCVISVLANTAEDTYLKVYDACGGTMISDNDDVRGTSHEVNEDFDAASAADFYGEADHTYYIYWTEEWGGNGPFDFSLTVNEEEGAICETAKEIMLPMYGDTAISGSTTLTGDFYDDDADLCDAHYLGGNDFVYTFTCEEPVLLSGSIDNEYAGMHIVTKPIGLFGAATESSALCAAFAYYDTKPHSFSNKHLGAGTYYVVVSTWPKPQSVDFTIHLTTEEDTSGVGVDELSLLNRISVYPNPNTGRFNIAINSNNSENIVVELINIQGQRVYRNEIKNATNSVESIDISEFAKGIYYIRVNNGTDVAIRKVVVQ